MPRAVGNAPPEIIDQWVEALASAVASGEFDYANRFAYGAFNLVSALNFAGLNSWGCPTDCNMVSDHQHVLDGARVPAIDSQFTTGSFTTCMTKVWENAFVTSVFHERDINLDDVCGEFPDGHISFNECPGYKAPDRTKYEDYFQGIEFPPEPVNFGAFPPDASLGPTAYVLQSGNFPLFSVNGKGPNQRTLDLIEHLGGKCEKLDDAFARELGSRYGINGVEYADKTHYGVYFVFIPNPASESRGHMMLLTLNPQFGVTASGAHGGGSGAHAELLLLLKYQTDVIRCLSDADVLPMDGAHPLWRLVGDRGMRSVFPVARSIFEADARAERYATRHVRDGRKYGFGGSERTEAQKEQDAENRRKYGRMYGFGGSERTEAQRERDAENRRKYGFGGSERTEAQKEQDAENIRKYGFGGSERTEAQKQQDAEYSRKYGFGGSERTEAQREQDAENRRRNGRIYGFGGSERTEAQREQDAENRRKYGFGGSERTEAQKQKEEENRRKHGFGGSERSERTEAQKEQERLARIRGGQAFHVRDMPRTTCPVCNSSDVRLTWRISPNYSVKYSHKRCVDDKSKSRSIKIADETAWRALLAALDDDQFETHKRDVLEENQRVVDSSQR